MRHHPTTPSTEQKFPCLPPTMKYQDVTQLILSQSKVPTSLLPHECLQLDFQGVPQPDDPVKGSTINHNLQRLLSPSFLINLNWTSIVHIGGDGLNSMLP